jgi:hypothetical protein
MSPGELLLPFCNQVITQNWKRIKNKSPVNVLNQPWVAYFALVLNNYLEVIF